MCPWEISRAGRAIPGGRSRRWKDWRKICTFGFSSWVRLRIAYVRGISQPEEDEGETYRYAMKKADQ